MWLSRLAGQARAEFCLPLLLLPRAGRLWRDYSRGADEPSAGFYILLHIGFHFFLEPFLPLTGELLRVSDYKVHPSSLLAVSLLYAVSCRLMEQEIYMLWFDCSRYRGQKKWLCGQSWIQAN